ncbi:hypothetical protein [Streptomyces melanogenes]|uniref:hypothetical protein n=1 Tax=Streptomyces melanogenes TaxID=67326 RepID=UPI00167DF273|nr:hypothetical protein [Streptomyces melanogenes]
MPNRQGTRSNEYMLNGRHIVVRNHDGRTVGVEMDGQEVARGRESYMAEIITRVLFEAGQEGNAIRLGSTTAWLSPVVVNRDDLWCLVFRNGYGARSHLITDLDQIQKLLDDVNR